jgi:hypothetical protein
MSDTCVWEDQRCINSFIWEYEAMRRWDSNIKTAFKYKICDKMELIKFSRIAIQW